MREFDMEKKMEELKARNEILTAKLVKVNERLKESEAFKSHFLSNVTNEIVNPFSSVMVLSENIQKLQENEMPRIHKMAGLIYDEAFQLDFQLKNIFAAAMIEAGLDDVVSVETDLEATVNQTIRFFDRELTKKELRISFDIAEGVDRDKIKSFHVDVDKLELVIKNLLSNAVKYSPHGAEIILKLEMVDENVKLTVRDFGKGIPKHDFFLIFDRFKQLDSRINSINTGHGLGLSIVNAYVLSFGGQVELGTPKDVGLEISILFPELESSDDWENLEDFFLGSDEKF